MDNMIIRTTRLSKAYHHKPVVSSLDLEVPAGSIYGFLGPNGAGKSTTMKMLLGLVKPDDGQIELFHQPSGQKNRIALLAQTGSLIESPSYYGHLTGRENLELIASLKRIPKTQVGKVLAIVHLEAAKDKKAKHYSLGMKQRLGLAGALLGFPKLLLLDEPTNGLDPAGIQEIRQLICTLPEKYGMTVLVSSHLLSEIDQMASHVGIIDHGELIFQDRLDTLHESSRPHLILHTTNDKKALSLFKEYKYPASIVHQKLTLKYLPDKQVYEIGKLLYAHQIGILRLTEEQRSLEDIFLTLTGRDFH